jgi:hypothetical protein
LDGRLEDELPLCWRVEDVALGEEHGGDAMRSTGGYSKVRELGGLP